MNFEMELFLFMLAFYAAKADEFVTKLIKVKA